MDKTKEIDVLALARKVLKEKFLLAKFMAVFAVIGVVYALSKPKEWTSVVVLASEATSMGMTQSLGDIASMIGIGAGGSGSVDAIYPDIYPDIFVSSDFVLKLFDVKVRTKKNPELKTYYEHLDKDVPIPFWSYPRKWVGELLFPPKEATGEPFPGELSKKDADICDVIRESISCQLDVGTNVITITATDIDPYVSTILVDTLQRRLQSYITSYRTRKAILDLEYAKKANEKAYTAYHQARQDYADAMEGHQSVILASVSSKIEDLRNEMDLRQNFYAQTMSQVEHAMLKVQETTPAFTIIQSATVPQKASSLPRSIQVLIFLFLGVLADAAWVLFLRQYVKDYKARRKHA